MVDEYSEAVHSGYWVSNECFVLINSRGNINYLIGDRVMKFGQTNKKQFILGYDGKQSRLYLIDKSLNIHAHRLLMSVFLFQSAILQKDMQTAKALLPQVPQSQYNKLAKFLEAN